MFVSLAPSVADVQAAIEYIFPLVYEFRKEKPKNDVHANKKRKLSTGETPVFEEHIQKHEVVEVEKRRGLEESDNSDCN